jgi:hypothetical protein
MKWLIIEIDGKRFAPIFRLFVPNVILLGYGDESKA